MNLWIWALALISGLIQAFSIADPWTRTSHGAWQIFSLALMFALWMRPAGGRWQVFWQTWVFALVWFSAAMWWLFISMHTYGGLPALAAALAVGAIAGFMALFYAAVALAFKILTARLNVAAYYFPLRCATAGASLWTLAELARGKWLTGLPWGAGGYAHIDSPLAGYAPWIGVYGIGWVSSFLACALAALCMSAAVQFAQQHQIFKPPNTIRGKPVEFDQPPGFFSSMVTTVISMVLLAIVPLAQHLSGRSPTDALHPPMTVALLQGNIPQDEKFIPGKGIELSLLWYGGEFERASADVVIAPETAIPLLPEQLPDSYMDRLIQHYSNGKQALITGIPLGNNHEGFTNSVIALGAQSKHLYRYDKHHLVPFGEFIPPMFRWFVDMMNIPMGDFNRGALVQPSFEWQGERFAPTICFEDLFGEEIAARFAQPKTAPTILLNISNLGWFGNTVILNQHLNIGRMRALELDRTLISATNTGASAVIDEKGRVTATLAYYTQGSVTGLVRGRTTITFFAWWASRAGQLPLWGLFTVVLILAFPYRGRARQEGAKEKTK